MKTLVSLTALLLPVAQLRAQTAQDFDATGNLATVRAATSGPPQIVAPPASKTVAPGATVTLTVLAGGGSLTYQWQKNGADIPGQVSDALTITGFTAGDEADYTVVVTNASGSTPSAAARLSLDSDFDGLPDEWEQSVLTSLAWDGIDDRDSDGRTNGEEYEDGTDPLDYSSAFVRLTLTGGGGALLASPPGSSGRYAPGTLVTITGHPPPGYEVSAWENASPAGANQATVLLGTRDVTVTAVFGLVATPVSLAEALDDTAGLTFATGGEQPWAGATGGVAYDGIDAAHSGSISRFGDSWLETTVAGPGVLSFRWKSSCHSGDTLTLSVNGAALNAIAGETPWQLVEMAIPAGAHTLRWRFLRGSANSFLNDNRVWLDRLQWLPGAPSPLAEALDLSGSVIATGGAQPWFVWGKFTPLEVTGFDADVIAGSGDTAGASGNVWTAVTTADLGTAITPVLRETAGAPGTAFLPADGLLSRPDGDFRLADDAGMNGLLVEPLDSRTLSLTTPAPQRAVRLLVMSVGGDSEMMCELEFADGARQATPAVFFDWRQTIGDAWQVAVFNRFTGSQSSNYYLQSVTVPVLEENWSRSLAHVSLRPSGGSPGAVAMWIFAVSGAGEPSGTGDFAASGVVEDDLTSWLSVLMTGPGAVSTTYALPQFLTGISYTLDGVSVLPVSNGWQNGFHRLGGGPHVLQWTRQPEAADWPWWQLKVSGAGFSAAVPLETALDGAGLTWSTGGASGWEGYALGGMAHDGADLAVSGAVGAGQESWVEAAFTGPGTLAWQWRHDAGATDELQLVVDGETVHTLTSTGGWEPALHTFGAGAHSVRWRYLRSINNPVNPDAVFLDEVSFTPGTPPLEQALDLPAGFHVFSCGSAVWVPQSAENHDGTDAAASGAIGDSQSSRLVLRGAGPAELSWWRKTSTASGDNLVVSVNGTTRVTTGGTNDWAQVVLQLEPGANRVEWSYNKNTSATAGSDTVWLDELKWTAPLPLGDALDAPALTWTTGGAGGWSGSDAASVIGGSAGVSGGTPHSQESWMQTTVTGPGTVSFQWMISASSGDEVRFLVDGEPAAIRAGAGTDWQPVMRTLSPGLHTLRWSYVKDASGVSGDDLARVDAVTFTPGDPPPLDDAVEAPQLDWLSFGPLTFTPQTAESHDGTDALQSGAVDHSQTSYCSARVTGPGLLTFWWRVSSASGDNFRFWMDGVQITSISGEQPWAQVVRQIPSGAHTVEWSYAKNGSTVAGSDAGWLDEVIFEPGSGVTLADALDGGGLTWTTGGAGAWGGAGGSLSHDGTDVAHSGYLDINSSAWLETTVTGPGTFSFWWNASGSSGDVAQFSVNGAVRHSESGVPGWRPVVQTLGPGTHTLRFTYSKDGGAPAAGDGLYLDEVSFVSSAPLAAPLAEAVESTREFLTYQNAAWFVQGAEVHDGATALQAGAIGDSQESRLQTVVEGPGTLSFWWKVSSQSGSDLLRLYVNGIQDTSIGGTLDWVQVVRYLNPGENIIEWRYTKNANTTAGSDTGWLDRVEFDSGSTTLAAALDGAGLTWSSGASPGAAAWLPQQMSVAHDGADAAFSPALDPSQQTWMETTVTGPGFLTFWWKTLGASGDMLKVFANGEEQHALTGTADWQPVGVAIPPGACTFRWLWQRGTAARSLTQGAVVDEVSFSPQTPAELADAVDATGMTLVTSGHALWGRQTTVTNDGTDAAASGLITHSQETWMQTRLTGPGTLTFWRRVSSQSGGDLFHFLNDGTVIGAHTASGEQAFALQTYTVAPGSHALRWRYSKNATTTTGSDMAWVDEIAFAPAPAVALDDALDGAGLTWTTGGGSGWTGASSAAGAHDTTDFAVSGQPAAGATSWIETGVTGPGTLTFWWRGGSSAADDKLSLIMDGTVTLTEVTGATAWLPVTATIGAGPHTLRWDFAPAGGAAASPGRVMQLDEVAFTPEAVPALLDSAAPAAGVPPGVVALVSSGTAVWAPQTTVTHDGVSAPASGTITHNQDTWLEAIIDGPGEGGAWWNVNSHANDRQRLSIDGIELASIGGTTALWERPSFYLGAGQHRVRWRYVKDGSSTTAPDTAWMDELVWNSGAANSPGTAIGMPSQTLLTQGALPWSVQTTVTKDGVSALASGAITHNQQSGVMFNTTGPGWISYWWKVDSQSGSDVLRHYEDGVQSAVISGAVDWNHMLRRTPPGTRVHEWRYSKNATTSTGADTGWLDEVEFAAPGDLAAALDGAGLTWTTGGDAPWAGYALEYSADGADSASSGDIGDGEESWIETTVTGPGTLTFSAKVLAHSSDLFTLTVDGGEPEGLTATTWSAYQRTLGSGPHTLRWAYTKSAATSTAPDSAWLDQVTWTPGTPPLADAADLTEAQLFTFGDAQWFRQTLVSYDGVDALQAGPVDHSQNSRLTLPVTGPAVLNFYWKVSSASSDNLRWYLDGVQQDAMSGEVDWERQTGFIPPGPHLLEWRYEKNANTVAGSDTGWVDRIEIVSPGTGYAAALEAPALTFTTGGSLPWQTLALSMAHDGTDMAASGGVPTGQESWLETTVTGPGTVSFWQKTSTHSTEPLVFSINGGVWRTVAGEVDWQEVVAALPAGSHTLRWTWRNESTTTSGLNTVWLDEVQFTPASPPPLSAAAGDGSGTWLTASHLPWSVTGPAESHDGIAAAGSGAITHSQTSALITRVEGPVWLSFWWKVSCQASSDTLSFLLDGASIAAISGEPGWQQVQRQIGPGWHEIEWRYAKNASVSSGADRGWVDEVRFVSGSPVGDALDGAGLTWTTDGWNGLAFPGAGHDGTDAAVSGLTSGGQSGWIETTVTGPGTFTFWWKQDTPLTADEVHFSIDGAVHDTLSGTVPWRPAVCSLPAGAHTLRWTYARAPGTSTALAAAMLDECTWTPSDPAGLAAALDVTSPALYSSGTQSPWFYQTTDSTDGVDALRSGVTPDSGMSWLTTQVSGPALVTFDTKVSSEFSDRLYFYLDGSPVYNNSGLLNWRSNFHQLSAGRHSLEWRYIKSSSTTAGEDAAWLDRLTVTAPGPVAPALEGAGLTFTTGGHLPWVGYELATHAHDGVDFAASGNVPAGQQSWLETSVTGPGTLTFWMLSGVPSSNDISIQVDGKHWLTGAAASDWTPVAIALGAGPHTVRWSYNRTNFSLGTGLTSLRLDEVVWTPQAVPPLFASFDIPVSTVVARGGNLWFNQTAVALDAGGALEAAATPVFDTTDLFAEVPGPGTLVFQHRAMGHTLDWNLDDNFFSYLPESTDGSWLPVIQELSPGIHRLQITGNTSPSAPAGSAARFDRVITGTATSVGLAEALDAPGFPWTTSGVLPWQGVTGTLIPASDGTDCALSSVNLPDGLESWVETSVTGPGVATFRWMVAPGFNSNLELHVDGLYFDSCYPEGQWVERSVPVPAGTHVLRWVHYDYGGGGPSGLDQFSFVPGFDFAGWQALHFDAAELADPLISGFTADPDRDGLTNGVEAMTGRNPRSASPEPLSAVLDESGPDPVWVISFTVPDTAPIDVTTWLETSTDMETDWFYVAYGTVDVWTVLPPASISEAPAGPGLRLISVTVPADSPRLSARLLVTQP